jgi:hypothetical protein
MEDGGIFMAVMSILRPIDIFVTPIWHILWSFGTFCGHLAHFVVIWHILWSFGTFCGHLEYMYLPVLVRSTKKNLAPLLITSQRNINMYCSTIQLFHTYLCYT